MLTNMLVKLFRSATMIMLHRKENVAVFILLKYDALDEVMALCPSSADRR